MNWRTLIEGSLFGRVLATGLGGSAFLRGISGLLTGLGRFFGLLIGGSLLGQWIGISLAQSAGEVPASVWEASLTGKVAGFVVGWAEVAGETGGRWVAESRSLVLGYLSSPRLILPWFMLMGPFLPTTVNVAMIWGIAAFAFGARLARGEKHRRIALALPLGLLLLALASAALGSIDLKRSLLELFLWGSYLLLFVLVSGSPLGKGDLVRMVTYTLAGGFLTGLVGVYQWVAQIKTPAAWVEEGGGNYLGTRIYSVFANPNFFSMYLVLLVPLVLTFLLRGGTRQKALAVVSGLLMAVCLVYTFSRGGWVAASVAAAIWILLVAPKFWWLFPASLLTIPFLPAQVMLRLVSIGNLTGGHMLHYRILIWEGTIPLILGYPLTGLGLGANTFVLSYPTAMLAGIPAYHAHNIYLEVLLETGLVGLVAFVYFFASFYRYTLGGWASRWRELGKDPILLGLVAASCAAVAANLIHGLEEDVWYDPHVNIVIWAVIGFGVAARRLLESGDQNSRE